MRTAFGRLERRIRRLADAIAEGRPEAKDELLALEARQEARDAAMAATRPQAERGVRPSATGEGLAADMPKAPRERGLSF